MEYNEKFEDLRESICEAREKAESAKGITEDFFERLEHEKTKEGATVNSKEVAFGSTYGVEDYLEKYDKAKEEYNYKLEQLEKSISDGEKSVNEKIDVDYAKRAVERSEIDLKYAKKYNS